MAKILAVNLQNSDVTIGMDDGSVAHVPLKEFDFVPEVNSSVEVFKDGDNFIINRSSNAVVSSTSNTNTGNTVVISRVTYVLLAWFLGLFGAHKFYEGKVGVGFAFIAMFILGFVLFIPGLVEIVFIFIDVIEALKAKTVESMPPGMMEVKKGGFFLTAIK